MNIASELQDQLVFKLLQSSPYPFISRLDRTIYQGHEQLDPPLRMKSTLKYIFAGYLVGKYFKRPLLFTGLVVFSSLCLFLKDQYDYSLNSYPQFIENRKQRKVKALQAQKVQMQKVEKVEKVEQGIKIKKDSRIVIPMLRLKKMPVIIEGKPIKGQDFVDALHDDYFS